MRKRRSNEETNIFSAGTDLVLSMVALVLILWAFSFKDLKETEADLAERKDELEEMHESFDAEVDIRQELLGIRGTLEDVVFVIDRSGSMKESIEINSVTKSGWEFVSAEVLNWIRYLTVERAALVLFSSDIETFPGGGEFYEITDENRELFAKRFSEVVPDGRTETYKALETAYGFEGVDTIILFTDGQPWIASGPQDPSVVLKDFKKNLYQKNPSIVVHTVGLGKYYEGSGLNQGSIRFLKELAALTGGSFRAR